MLVLNLGCSLEHRFGGWFGSAEDFESQLSRALVECPVCGSAEVRRLPNATRLNVEVFALPVPAVPEGQLQ